jgi:hypothetical protein
MELPDALKSLPGNMLLCCDGNHRLIAWMEALVEENALVERLREQMVDYRIYRSERSIRGEVQRCMCVLNK